MKKRRLAREHWLTMAAVMLFSVYFFTVLFVDGVRSTVLHLVLRHISSIAWAMGVGAVAHRFRQQIKPFPVLLALSLTVISLGELYFIPRRPAMLLYLFLTLVSLGYLAFTLIVRGRVDSDGVSRYSEKKKREEGMTAGNEKALVAFCLSLFLLVDFVARTLSLDKALGETAFPWGIFAAAGLVAAALTVIYACHLVKKREVRKKLGMLFLIFLIAALLLSFLIYAGFQSLNYGLDASRGEEGAYAVTEHRVDLGGRRSSTTYEMTVIIDGEEMEMTVPRAVYEAHPDGSRITLYRHEGAFGYGYYEYRWEDVYRYPDQ